MFRGALDYSCDKLCSLGLTVEQLTQLEDNPALAETIEAFASRLGRMQDTIAGKLFPRYLQARGYTKMLTTTHQKVGNHALRTLNISPNELQP